jgi:UDP-glucose 4-epimerase
VANLTTGTIVITGVAGFIGRYVARHFQRKGWTVVGTDNSTPENAPTGNLSSYHRMRLPDEAFGQLLESVQPDILVHCAGRAAVALSVENPHSDFYSNAVVTFEILDAVRKNAPNCRTIFLSSAAVYGNPEALPIAESCLPSPVSPYGFHKLQSEQLCAEFSKIYGLKTASTRIFSAYGPGLRRQVIWDICQKAILQDSLILQGTGEESRDFIHALDITQAIDCITQNAEMNGEVYNLATGEEVKIRSLVNLVLESLEIEQQPEFNCVVPAGVPLNWRADISSLRSLGFEPTVSFDRGIKTFAYWCRAELLGV